MGVKLLMCLSCLGSSLLQPRPAGGACLSLRQGVGACSVMCLVLPAAHTPLPTLMLRLDKGVGYVLV